MQVATDAKDALRVLKTKNFDLMFTDIVLPGDMDGIELAYFARQHIPKMKILMTSGFSVIEKTKIEDLRAGFVNKPYRKMEIAFALRTLLGN